MPEIFTNLASSRVVGNITATATSINVLPSDQAEFPVLTSSSDFFTVVMVKKSTGQIEIARVTGHTAGSHTFSFGSTANRGLEGTSALSINDGDLIELRPTAAYFNGLASKLDVQENLAFYPDDNNAANTLHIDVDPAPTAYTDGMTFYVRALTANTGPFRFEVNNLGLRDVVSSDGLPFNGLFFHNNDVLILVYEAATARFRVVNVEIPCSTRMLFYQASAPTGWSQVTSTALNNAMMRVVTSTGGGTGGTDNPILNDKVPTHTHTFMTGESGEHTHSLPARDGQAQGGHDHNTRWFGGLTADQGSSAGEHTHTGTTDANPTPSNWTPKYVDVIVCQKR